MVPLLKNDFHNSNDPRLELYNDQNIDFASSMRNFTVN